MERYENENFPSLIQKVWSEELSFPDGQKISLEKFYKQLHAYVRRKLRNFYSYQVKHKLERIKYVESLDSWHSKWKVVFKFQKILKLKKIRQLFTQQIAVYFDHWFGAVRSKCWSKSPFFKVFKCFCNLNVTHHRHFTLFYLFGNN